MERAPGDFTGEKVYSNECNRAVGRSRSGTETQCVMAGKALRLGRAFPSPFVDPFCSGSGLACVGGGLPAIADAQTGTPTLPTEKTTRVSLKPIPFPTTYEETKNTKKAPPSVARLALSYYE